MTVYGSGFEQTWVSNDNSVEQTINFDGRHRKDFVLRRTIDAYNRTVDIQPENTQTCIDAQLNTLSQFFGDFSPETLLSLAELVRLNPDIDSKSLLYYKLRYEAEEKKCRNESNIE